MLSIDNRSLAVIWCSSVYLQKIRVLFFHELNVYVSFLSGKKKYVENLKNCMTIFLLVRDVKSFS